LGKRHHVVETLTSIDVGTSLLLDAHGRSDSSENPLPLGETKTQRGLEEAEAECKCSFLGRGTFDCRNARKS
jgi:hypothetical protein